MVAHGSRPFQLQSTCTLAILLCLPWAGCGPAKVPTGRVSGVVTFKGEPVSEGTITFRDDQRGIVAAMTLGSEGEYQLFYAGGPDVPVGEYFITITPPEPHVPIASEGGDGKMEPAGYREWPEIPEKYRNINTSGEKFTITEGVNVYDLEMTDG